ncbi:MAG: hypothetical protein DRN20_03995 [Thermoplasmata archaeon]|nr:MAG: hypothetical protein DRN20_03995 [Thermoplasmata archaeon]
MDETKKALTYAFRVLGKSLVDEEEFILTLSVKLQWFSPEEAKEFVSLCKELALIAEEKGFLRPRFNHNLVNVPIDFKVSSNILDRLREYLEDREKEEHGEVELSDYEAYIMEIVDRIADKIGADRKQVIAEVNDVQERLGVEIEAALNYVANKYDIDVKEYAKKGYEIMISRLRGEG